MHVLHLHVDLMNFLPVISLPGTEMSGIVPPDENRLENLVAQIHYYSRCRSNATGLLTLPAVV